MPPWSNVMPIDEKLDWLLKEIKSVETIILQMQGDLAIQIDILVDLKERVSGLEGKKNGEK